MSEVTREQVQAVIEVTKAIGDLIQEVGSVPDGELYARCMGVMNLATYNSIIDTLVGAKLVTRKNHLLTWVGPAKV